MLERSAAAEEERLGAEPVADRGEAGAVRFGVREPAEVLDARCGPQQEVDLQVVVAPVAHDAPRQVVQPGLHLRVGAVERVDLAPPVVARVPDDRSVGILEQPLGVRGGDAGAVGHGEGSDPQPRLQRAGVDAVGEPAVAVRELRVRVPVAGGFLVAVVELDQAKVAAIERRGAELEIRDDIVLGHVAEQFVPRAPSGRDRDGGEPLPVDRGGGPIQRRQGREPVSIGGVTEPQDRGVARGAEGAGRQPVAHRLEAVFADLHLRLAGLAGIERQPQAARPASQAQRGETHEVRHVGRGPHALDVVRAPGVVAVDQCGEVAVAGKRVRELKEAHPPHRGQHAVGVDRERHRGQRHRGRVAGKELGFEDDAGGAPAYQDRLAAGGLAAADGGIFEIGERDQPVADPGAEGRRREERNAAAVAAVPQRPVAAVVELEDQPPHRSLGRACPERSAGDSRTN